MYLDIVLSSMMLGCDDCPIRRVKWIDGWGFIGMFLREPRACGILEDLQRQRSRLIVVTCQCNKDSVGWHFDSILVIIVCLKEIG